MIGEVTTVLGVFDEPAPQTYEPRISAQQSTFEEPGGTGWFDGNVPNLARVDSFTRTTTHSRSGVASLKVTAGDHGDGYGRRSLITATTIAVGANEFVRAGAWALKDANAGAPDVAYGPAVHFGQVIGYLTIDCYGTYLGTPDVRIGSSYGGYLILSTTKWEELPIAILRTPAQTEYVYVSVGVYLTGRGWPYYDRDRFAIGSSFYVDDVFAEVVSQPSVPNSSIMATRIHEPVGVAIDPNKPDLMYVTENSHSVSRVRRVDFAANTVTTLAEVAVVNAQAGYSDYLRGGFYSVAVSGSGNVYCLNKRPIPDRPSEGIYGRHFFEVWRLKSSGNEVIFSHDSSNVDEWFGFGSLVVSRNEQVFLRAEGSKKGSYETFNGILRVTGPTSYVEYAGTWGPYSPAPIDGPRLSAAFSVQNGPPYSQHLAIDSSDNIWVADYRMVRRIDSKTGEVTTPVGLIRTYKGHYSTGEAYAKPIDPTWVNEKGGGPGGLRGRGVVAAYPCTYPWAIAVTWNADDPHVFTYDDWGAIHHVALKADLFGTYLSGERVIRDSPYGRRAASHSCYAMAYGGGYLYFAERYGPTIRRIEVGGAGEGPRAVTTGSEQYSRVRRR